MINLWCLMFAGFLGRGEVPIYARIDLTDARHQMVSIEMVFPPDKTQKRWLELSAPSLEIDDANRLLDRVSDLRVTNLEGNPLTWTKTKRHQIEVQVPEDAFFKIDYAFRANRTDDFGAYVDSVFGLIFPATLLFHDPQNAATPVAVEFVALGEWTVATSMTLNAQGRYQANDWRTMASTVFLIGHNRKFDFDVNGVPHRWTLCGQTQLDEVAAVKALQKLASQANQLTNQPPDRMIDVFSRFELEGDSFVMALPHVVLLSSGSAQATLGADEPMLLRYLSWAYFRAWLLGLLENGRVSWDSSYQNREMPSVAWVMDQFFAYYSPVLLVRSAFWGEADLRGELSAQLEHYLENPDRISQQLRYTSFDLPEKRLDLGHPVQTNALRVFALDLFLRNRTQNEISADDFFRFITARIAAKARQGWRDVFAWLEHHAGNEGVLFFQQYFVQSKPLPFEQVLEYAGLKITRDQLRPAEHQLLSQDTPRAFLGIETEVHAECVRVVRVKPGSPAWEAGIVVGDEWISMSGMRVNERNRDVILNWFMPGDIVPVVLNRNGRLIESPVSLAADPGTLNLVVDAETTDLQDSIFQSIFGAGNAVQPTGEADTEKPSTE